MTARALRKRLDRLEASLRASADRGACVCAPPPLNIAKMRVILRMLIEAGALELPAPGEFDRWRDLRQALYGLDDLPLARSADE